MDKSHCHHDEIRMLRDFCDVVLFLILRTYIKIQYPSVIVVMENNEYQLIKTRFDSS